MLENWESSQTEEEKSFSISDITDDGTTGQLMNSISTISYFLNFLIIFLYLLSKENKFMNEILIVGLFYIFFVLNLENSIKKGLQFFNEKIPKDLKQGDKTEINLRNLKKSLLMSIPFFILMTIPPYFLLNKINLIIDFPQSDIESSQRRLIWMLPIFFLRIVNSQLLAFFRISKQDEYIGYAYLLQLAIFFQISYVILEVMNLGMNGVIYILLGYEAYTFITHLYYFASTLDIIEENNDDFYGSMDDLEGQESKNSAFRGIGIHSLWLLYFLLIEIIWSLVILLQIYLILNINSKKGLGLFFIYLFTGVVYGYSVEVPQISQDLMAKSLKEDTVGEIIGKLRAFKRLFLLVGVIYASVWLAGLFGLEFFFSELLENLDIMNKFKILKFVLLAHVFVTSNFDFQKKFGDIIGVEFSVLKYKFFLLTIVRAFGAYILCLYFGYGIIGIVAFEGVLNIGEFLIRDGYLDTINLRDRVLKERYLEGIRNKK